MLSWTWAVERLAVARNYSMAASSTERAPHDAVSLSRDEAFVRAGAGRGGA